MATALPLGLLDLPPDLLIRIGAQLPFIERLQLSLVCRRWRDVCAGPSELWSHVDARIAAPDIVVDPEDPEDERELFPEMLASSAAKRKLEAYREWLAPRVGAVADLTFQLEVQSQAVARLLGLELPSCVLPSQAAVPCMPALRHMAVNFRGRAELSFAPCPALPALRTLWMANMRLQWDNQHARIFGCFSEVQGLEFGMYHGQLDAVGYSMGDAWLPPCTTKLRLLNVGLRDIPHVATQLPRLRSLELDANGTLRSSSLTRLSSLTQLQQLDLGENTLTRFPSEVRVCADKPRILFLYQNFGATPIPAEDWDALRPLSQLVFLSISSNNLLELPPAVAAMTHLRGLHIEDNLLAQGLASHPCLSNLVELLLDWKDALRGPAVLRACTRLTRLSLHNHGVFMGAVGLPALWGDSLLDAIAAMPSLRLLEDVVNPQQRDLLVPAVARCMWEAGRRCPHLRLEQISSTYIGWSLGNMPPEVEAEVAASDAAAESGAAAADGGGLAVAQPHA